MEVKEEKEQEGNKTVKNHTINVFQSKAFQDKYKTSQIDGDKLEKYLLDVKNRLAIICITTGAKENILYNDTLLLASIVQQYYNESVVSEDVADK